MRVLTVHNYPGDFATGGEGNVFRDEANLLRQQGHAVLELAYTNAAFMNSGTLRKAKAFVDAPWSSYGYRLAIDAIRSFKPDVMHVHNFFFVLSPSVFRAAKDSGVATVATLHNYRLVAPCSQLLLNGRVCERCVGKNPWRLLFYQCYRSSFLANLLRYRVYYLGQKWHGWVDDIDVFISLTEFAKYLYVRSGLPKERIHVKPNSIADPIDKGQLAPVGSAAVYVGRISREKGILTLLRAWEKLRYPLHIVGDGPLMPEVRQSLPPSVKLLGELPHDKAMKVMKKAAFVVFPSLCYEGFGLTLIEAMATGRAVVASDLGARSEIVKSGVTGWLYPATDYEALRQKVQWLIDNPVNCAEMGIKARKLYLEQYTMAHTYNRLMQIYDEAVNRSTNTR